MLRAGLDLAQEQNPPNLARIQGFRDSIAKASTQLDTVRAEPTTSSVLREVLRGGVAIQFLIVFGQLHGTTLDAAGAHPLLGD